MNNYIPASNYCKKVFDGTHDTPKPVLIGFPLITSKNILGGLLNLKDSYNISDTNYKEIQKRSKVSQWDILFSMIGSVGEIYLEKNAYIPYAIKNVGVFSCEDEYRAKWLYYYLKSPQARRFIQNYLNGAVQKFLPLGALRNFPVLPFDKKHISSIDLLFALDSKIELNNRINAELEAMAKTLYDYWFVQFDFPGKNGKPYKSSGGKMVWNEELKREIPEGWEVIPLSEITDVSNESVNPMDFPDKEFKYYSIPGFDESGTFKIEKGFEIKSNKYSIKSTDVLVSKLNPWFSRVIYATDDSNLISSTEFVVWRIENLAMKNYMYMIARDASFITFCTKSASGTSNSHKRVNPIVMMKYKIVFNETVATLFGNTLGSSIKMLEKSKIENQKLTELRDWLLPMLMNGQVKVN